MTPAATGFELVERAPRGYKAVPPPEAMFGRRCRCHHRPAAPGAVPPGCRPHRRGGRLAGMTARHDPGAATVEALYDEVGSDCASAVYSTTRFYRAFGRIIATRTTTSSASDVRYYVADHLGAFIGSLQ